MDEILYKNKYRINSARKIAYDYSQNGMYFATICTKDKRYFFGKIVKGKIILNQLGKFADKCWQKIPEHYPFVVLNKYIIMPNHIHGIIIINVETQHLASKNNKSVETQQLASNDKKSVETQHLASENNKRDARYYVSTINKKDAKSCVSTEDYFEYKNKFGPQSNNLSAIVRGFKIGVTKFSKKFNVGPIWQSRFYDHIIRNEDSLGKIQQYIINNPIRWELDKNNLENENVWF